MFTSDDKFTIHFKKVIQRAAWLCLNDFKKVINPDHLLLAILTVPESLAYELLKSTGIIQNKQNRTSRALDTKIQPKPHPKMDYNKIFNLSMDKDSIQILEKAAEIAIRYKQTFIGTEHLLASMLELRVDPLMQKITKAQINITDLQKKLHSLLQANVVPYPQSTQSRFAQDADKERSKPQARLKTNQSVSSALYTRPVHRRKKKRIDQRELLSTPAIDYFTTDLTHSKKQAKLHPLVGREEEINRVINILSRQHKNNPLLLGDPGVGKTAIVEGLAQKIYKGEVPDILANKRILRLDLNAVVAGTIYRGEFESRLKQIIEELKSQDDAILFIDEIHTLVGAGSASGSLDAANILKPYLARGELACIGATTLAEYKTYFEADATLERRFQPIIIEEPSPEETKEILKGIRKKMEDFHQVTITDDALEETVSLSERFLPNKFFPDKAIGLLDEAASRIKVAHVRDIYGKKIKEIKEQLKQLRIDKETAVRAEDFKKATCFKERERQLTEQVAILKKKQDRARHKKVGVIEKKDIGQIITEMVKIPFLELTSTDKDRLLGLEGILGQRVLGQDKVLRQVARTLRRGGVGLADPKRPLASFIFLGPSGVGKTETAKAIAEKVFGSKNALVRINMSELQESFNISKLIGAPAGYVGYKDGNQLADKVRSKPYSVILFDEMEKAHPDVFNLMLQILEDGYLLDAAGKHINFKNTVIIFTSNIGLERFNQAQSLGFAARSSNQKQQIQEQFEQVKEKILEELYKSFRVEFLNRIDKILVFEPLTYETLTRIVELNIKELNKRLTDRKLKINLSSAAKKWLARSSFSPDDGARSVRRIIQEKVEEMLVEKILRGDVSEGDELKIGVCGKRIVVNK
jgi:ATP-dependent Clp protease ATP-binding subunit ClpC